MKELGRHLTVSKENPGFSTVGEGGQVTLWTGKFCVSIDKNYFSLLAIIYFVQRYRIAAIESQTCNMESCAIDNV